MIFLLAASNLIGRWRGAFPIEAAGRAGLPLDGSINLGVYICPL